MRACEALILWDETMTPSVKVTTLGRDDSRYTYSGGAAYTTRREAKGKAAVLQGLLFDFVQLTTCGMPPKEVHGAFMAIDEYREAMAIDEYREAIEGDKVLTLMHAFAV